MIVNCDGYVSEVGGDVATIEFYGGNDCAGGFVARDAAGNELSRRSIGATFNLKHRPWYERIDEMLVSCPPSSSDGRA